MIYYESMSLEMVDFLKMNRSQQTQFQERVSSFHDQVAILVHPFFLEAFPTFGYPRPAGYETSRRKFVDFCIRTNSPLIILEQGGDYFKRLPTRLAALTSSDGVVYTAKTETESSILEKDDWKKFVAFLRQAEVRNILIGGIFMELWRLGEMRLKFSQMSRDLQLPEVAYVRRFPEFQEKLRGSSRIVERELVPTGCAGNTAGRLLMEGFAVNLLPASSPCSTLQPLASSRYLVPNIW